MEVRRYTWITFMKRKRGSLEPEVSRRARKLPEVWRNGRKASQGEGW